MKKTKLIVAMALTLSLLLSACGHSAGGNDNPDTPNTLTIGFGHSLDNYAPANAYETKSIMINFIYETIVRYDNGQIKPCLAERWEWNDDGTVLTLHIRQGVTFHDGEKLNAEAIAKNLRWANANPLYGFFKGISLIQEVTVTDEHTLTVKYANPYYAALQDMCAPVQLGIVSPAMLDMNNFESMNGTAGTGPYKYESFDTNINTAILEKNGTYWNGNVPYDKVLIRNIGDTSSRMMALKSGEVDLIFGSDWISYDDYEQAIKMDNVMGRVSRGDVKTQVLLLNAGSSVLSDAKVREAIAHTIDKKAIVDGLLHGHESVAEQSLSANLPYCAVDINTARAYDVEKAKTMLEQAGWADTNGDGIRDKDGTALKIKLKYPQERTINRDIGEVVKAQLAEIGVQVETQGLEYMVYIQQVIGGDYDLSLNVTNGNPYDPQNYINAILAAFSGEYPSIMALPDGQSFMDKGHQTLVSNDDVFVAAAYEDMLNYFIDNAIHVPISTQKELVLYRSDKIETVTFGGTVNFLDPMGIIPKQ